MVTWTDEVDENLASDLAAGFASLTPARGAVIIPMAPLALRDREAGTVTVTTSQAMWKKLDRIRRHHGVGIVYHARDHGLTRRSGFLLVQGRASSVRTEWSTRRTQRPAIGSALQSHLHPGEREHRLPDEEGARGGHRSPSRE